MKRSILFPAVAAITALTLAACGGGDGDGDGDGTAGGDGGGDATSEGTEGLPDTIILGLVPSVEVDKLTEDADRLGELLGEELGVEVETFISTDFAALVVGMQTGQADIGMFGPIALVNAVDQAHAVPVLQSIRYGSSSYHTQWFTTDTDTYCLDDVITETDDDGNEFAYCNGSEAQEGPTGEDALALIPADAAISFVDASSASGYYYPATQLGQILGIDPATGLTGATFAGGHPNSVLAVERGDAVVGTSFNDARENLIEENPTIGTDVTVFASSPEIPNDGIAVNGEFSEDAIQQITDAFLAIADTEEGAQVLKDVYDIDGLAIADVEALDVARQVAQSFNEG